MDVIEKTLHNEKISGFVESINSPHFVSLFIVAPSPANVNELIMAKGLKKTSEGFNEILLYTTPNGKVKVEIYLQNETIWLTQQKIAELFGVQRPAITKHLKNIFESGELKEDVVSSILEHTTQHGAIIYAEGELNKEATCAKIAQVQLEGEERGINLV